ncbi:MAG: PAS domain S-box protein [Pseudomonadota bacterium]
MVVDTRGLEQAIRFQLEHNEELIQIAGAEVTKGRISKTTLLERLNSLHRNSREIQRIIWLAPTGKLLASTDESTTDPVIFSPESQVIGERARVTTRPQYSKPAPSSIRNGPMLMDFHVPLFLGDTYAGSLVATYQLDNLMEQMVPWWYAQDYEVTISDSDDKLLAKRAAGGPGRGVYITSRSLELAGLTLVLGANSVKDVPRFLPNLLVGLVIALSLSLLWSLWLLSRDIARRLATENELRQQVLFRTAMENSLVTGLRARDLDGRVTYVNPSFCQMVGYPVEELVGKAPPMQYWAPEAMEEYQERFSKVLAGTITPQGFETIFQSARGKRVPVLIFESPLVDDSGKQTGWMSSILDISEQKKVEELNRQQQEKLQASARLATMGEMASMLAHEVNQPLAAISSYITGALNFLKNGLTDPEILRPVLEKTNAQAQRAGQIIRSVHEFVKMREPARHPLTVVSLIESIIPLVGLQAQQFFVSIKTSIESDLPPVLADRMLLEQVLLNLTRNAIEAMQHVAPEQRILRLTAVMQAATPTMPEMVVVSVIDQGHGISNSVAARLFSPFFSTKAEGMGMGLNICRTAIEFHGGTLSHQPNPGGGTIFMFSLPFLVEKT